MVFDNLRMELRNIFNDKGKDAETGPAEIVMKDVCFEYEKGHPIITDINLTLNKPGLYCIIGPNGVGKSTLIKCMCKIQDLTSGDVTINGNSIRNMSHKDVARYIGYVPVSAGDVFSMSVLETIMVGCQNRYDSSESKLKAVYKSMYLLNIDDLASKNFGELSAGQHQKVSIARGIVQKPKILILDEPTANLDVKYQVYVTELLRAMAEHENMIVLMISHDLNMSAKYAHKVIMMSDPGIIYRIGDPEEVITRENVETVYGVHCKIITDEDYNVPIVVLGQSIMDEYGNLNGETKVNSKEEYNGEGSRKIDFKVLGRVSEGLPAGSQKRAEQQETQR